MGSQVFAGWTERIARHVTSFSPLQNPDLAWTSVVSSRVKTAYRPPENTFSSTSLPILFRHLSVTLQSYTLLQSVASPMI